MSIRMMFAGDGGWAVATMTSATIDDTYTGQNFSIFVVKANGEIYAVPWSTSPTETLVSKWWNPPRPAVGAGYYGKISVSGGDITGVATDWSGLDVVELLSADKYFGNSLPSPGALNTTFVLRIYTDAAGTNQIGIGTFGVKVTAT